MKPFRASIQVSLVVKPGVLGVLVWSDDEARYVAAAGEQDRATALNTAIASCATSGRPLSDLIDYYMETGGGGYLSFSEPEVVEADTLADAAAMIAKRADITLVMPPPPLPPSAPTAAIARSDPRDTLGGAPSPAPARPALAPATSQRVVRPRPDASRRIRLARAVIEVLASDVSVAFFVWWKEPGNEYLSFYPTSMLPPRGSPRWNDESGGRRIFNAAVDPMADPPRPLTIGQYGALLAFPMWATHREVPSIWPAPKSSSGLPRLPRGLTTSLTARERIAVRAILAALDVRWLRANGSPDPATTVAVLGWIDAILDAMAASPGSDVRMSFERAASLEALLEAEVVGAGDTSRIAWPTR